VGDLMKTAIKFLLSNGGPVIKYRTIKELLESDDQELIQEAETELLEYSTTKKMFSYLQSKEKLYDFNGVHGTTYHHLENSLPILIDFGIKKGITPFDEIMEPIIKRLEKQVFPEGHVFSKFVHIIILPFLYKAGFREKWIMDFMEDRLETLYKFAAKKDYDIYDDITEYKGIPPTFRNRKVIKPELYKNGEMKFPLIHDIYGLSELIKGADKSTSKKVEAVINYILDPAYDDLIDGYGILVNGNNRYLAMGWDAKLPEINNDILSAQVLHRLELMAHFNVALNHEWFEKAYRKLEKYRTKDDTFIFPKEALQDNKGCWVRSRHMGVGENRRKKYAIELESTFRALKINKILQKHNL